MKVIQGNYGTVAELAGRIAGARPLLPAPATSPPPNLTPTSPPRHHHQYATELLLPLRTTVRSFSAAFRYHTQDSQHFFRVARSSTRSSRESPAPSDGTVKSRASTFVHPQRPIVLSDPLATEINPRRYPRSQQPRLSSQDLSIAALRLPRKVPEESSTAAQAERPPSISRAEERPRAYHKSPTTAFLKARAF